MGEVSEGCRQRWVLAFVAAFGKRQPELLMSKNTKADDMFCCQIDNVRLERKMKRELKLMLRRVSRHNANTFVTCLFSLLQ